MKTLKNHNYFGVDATIIADSITRNGDRLTTFICSFPRIVLAEFNTHRMLSRNSASSRAVPFDKMMEQIRDNPFIPIRWMKDHKGMQGNEYFEGTCSEVWGNYDRSFNYEHMRFKSSKQYLEEKWLDARDYAISCASTMSELGLTKQIVNRLLEPFKWHTVITTATSWENFFALRAHEAAEIHIQDLAFKMLDEYNNSSPILREEGQWHIPFSDSISESKIIKEIGRPDHIDEEYFQRAKMMIAIARCARVSYENYEGGDDYSKDIALYTKLASMGHWSPFEHAAQALAESERSGNFLGWEQHRKQFADENKMDSRVLIK